MAEYIGIFYVVASILFILGIKLMSSPDTARKGNFISAIGMLLAIIAAVSATTVIGIKFIVIGLIVGAVIGAFIAKTVAMTDMPQMVALLNGFGGIASLLVAFGEYFSLANKSVASKVLSNLANGDGLSTVVPVSSAIPIILTIVIGGITFTGSLVAWGKLAEKFPSKAIMFSGMKLVNIVIVVATLILSILAIVGVSVCGLTPMHLTIIVIVLSLVFGVLFVIPIGGADMPVVISLLNSYSGVAACSAGFAINSTVLVVSGALVGASGLILTQIMTKAMNRSLTNVLFSGFTSVKKSNSADSGETGEVKPINVEDTYILLEAASNVLIVPGYGMAVAQAQHVVSELVEQLEDNGAEVNFAIHPVAGRMPGHMNVLLAEANVPYDKLREMDEVNPLMENVDIAIIIGANDVVNPSAKENEGSPIYGMPVIEVTRAKNVIVMKRSMNAGFSGVENPLFFKDNTRMLFGDAKGTIQALVAEFKN